jgi:hypothetical protein
MAEGVALVFEARDFESCTAFVRQFIRERASANFIKVAVSTPDRKPLRARIWRIMDGNLEAATDIIVGFIMTHPRGAVTISARDE